MQSKLAICALIALLGGLDSAAACARAANPQARKPQPLTVAAMIELKLPLSTLTGATLQAVHMAPDGTHYLAVFCQGDIARNGNWVILMYGSTNSLAGAARVDTSLRLFTTANVPSYEWIKSLSWLDAHDRVAFVWDDGQKPAQIVQADLRTHTVQPLTQQPAAVTDFAISQDGETIVYAARGETERDAAVRERKRKYQTEGFTIADQNIWSLVRGDYDGWVPARTGRVFIMSRRDQAVREVPGPGRSWQPTGPEDLRLSPDGKYCLFNHLIAALPEQWNKYTDSWFRRRFSAAQNDLKGNEYLHQQFLLVITTGKIRPLWNAPFNPYGAALWTDNRHVVVGPAFLPVEHSDADGLRGVALAEVDVETGEYVSLPKPRQAGEALAASGNLGYAPLAIKAGEVEFGDASDTSSYSNAVGQVKLRLKKSAATGVWSVAAGVHRGERGTSASAVRIELRENSNTPPALYAVEVQSGRARKIYDPNPGLLDSYTLGRTELVHWQESNGTRWTGLLYYPVDYRAGTRYPLVIHTHGYFPADFAWSLSGGHTTAYAAQVLTNRGIAVLALRFPDQFREKGLFSQYMNTPREPQIVMAGVISAAEHLSKRGLIQPDKVGLVGFSRTGWYVEYILTHSAYPFAAAIAADNIQYSYGEYLTSSTAGRSDEEQAIGAKPYGEGLATWLREAPGFNADKMHTPLRMEQDSDYLGGVMNMWELFGNLRYLGRPVEAFFVPDIEHGGAHPLLSPLQRLASQGGAVDWFDFWLNGREDPDLLKAEQYRRWEQLCDMQVAQNLDQPASCVRTKPH